MPASLNDTLALIDGWGATTAAAAIVGPDGVLAVHGDDRHRFRWASLTKLVTALAVLTAVDDGVIDLDELAGPPDSTVRHLLAHASGLPFEGTVPIARPGSRRIYANAGYDGLGALLGERDGVDIDAALWARVLDPLGMANSTLLERPSQGMHGPVTDLAALVREFLRPTLLAPATATAMRTVTFPGLAGVLPGVGRFDPLDWGLGPELKDGKDPHWMGARVSAGTFGHFGGSGTFIWVDPTLDRACIALTDRPYDTWAMGAWPPFNDAVVEALTTAGR